MTLASDDFVKIITNSTRVVQLTALDDLAAFISSIFPAPPGSYGDADADLRVAAGIATHEAAPDPHPSYLTPAEGDAAYAPISVTQYTNEMAQDTVAALIQNGTGITWSYNDGADTLTPTVTITQYTDGMADARAAAAITTHVGLADPHTQYFLESAFNLSTFTTSDLAEGSNLYFTDERVDDRVSDLLIAGMGVALTYSDVGNSLTVDADIKQTEIDFGSTPVESGTFTITDATVTTSSNIIAQLAYIAPTDKDLDELEMDDLSIICGNGSGSFDMFVRASDGAYLADKFKINYHVG